MALTRRAADRPGRPTCRCRLPPDLVAAVRSVPVTETDEERSAFTLSSTPGAPGRSAARLAGAHRPRLRPGARSCWSSPSAWSRGAHGRHRHQTRVHPGSGAGARRPDRHRRGRLAPARPRGARHRVPRARRPAAGAAILAPYAARRASCRWRSRRRRSTHRCRSSGAHPARHRPAAPDRARRPPRLRDLRHSRPVPGTSTFYWGPPVRVGPAAAGALRRPRAADQRPRDAAVPHRRARRRSPSRVRCRTRAPATRPRSLAMTSLRPPLAAMPLCGATPRTRTAARERHRPRRPRSARAQAEVDSAVGRRRRRRGRARRGPSTAPCCGPAASSGCAAPAGPYDGLWYVRRVVHEIAPGSWTQKFTLAREGYGSTVPAVVVADDLLRHLPRRRGEQRRPAAARTGAGRVPAVSATAG